MAPPIKQENLPALEDCRLLLKNAINVKLNASSNFTTPWRSLFFWDSLLGVNPWFFGGCVCQSVRIIIIRGGLRGSNNQLSLIGQIFGTDFYVAYVNGQLRSIPCTLYLVQLDR
jgi:hypothetical protein